MLPPYVFYAVSSGLIAASTSVVGKFATDGSSPLRDLIANDAVFYAARVAFFGLYLLLNGVMWAQFSKAMALSTTLKASLVNTSANFVFTALLGVVFFGDKLPFAWWIGSCFLLAGFILVTSDTEDAKQGTEGHKRR
jgi:drug/metabolite transporter (DMT)-like permease